MTAPWERYGSASGPWDRYGGRGGQSDEDRRLQDLSGIGGEVGSFLSAAGDSLSLGFGDELHGAVAGLDAVRQGRDYGDAYGRQVERSRQRLSDAWRYHSGSALGGAIVGSLPIGGGVGLAARGARAGATAARALNPLQRVGAAALTGGAFGGAYGIGSSDAPLDTAQGLGYRALNGLTGAGMGAALGGAFQGVGMGAMHGWRSAIRPAFAPEERAAQELGRALERGGMTTPAQFAQRARQLNRTERVYAPGSNPMVMDVLGDAGSGLTMVAGARQSSGRVAMQSALEQRNIGARERIDRLLVSQLGGGQRKTVAQSLDELEDIQRKDAGPLFAQVHQGTVQNVPQRLRDFIAFQDRPGASFKAALETTRETMRRSMGASATDDQMMASPVFWHRLLENSSAEVGAAFRAARMTPLGAPRGSALADMTQDSQMLNQQVRALLGPDFRKAMDIYAGAARNQEAWETGFNAVRMDGGELQLGRFARQLSRMSPGEKEAVRHAAISGLRRAMAQADPGTGRANVLRGVIGNEARRANLRAIFGSDKALTRVMRVLDYENNLFQNYAATNLGRNSPTADKMQGAGQMFGADGGGLWTRLRQELGRDAQQRYDEQMATSILDLMRTPVAGPGAPRDIQAFAQQRGLLSRALRDAERRRTLRPIATRRAYEMGAVNSLGFSPESQ